MAFSYKGIFIIIFFLAPIRKESIDNIRIDRGSLDRAPILLTITTSAVFFPLNIKLILCYSSTAANAGKDQLPAYTSHSYQASTSGDSAGPSTTPTLMLNHSTRAAELSRATSEGIYTTSQYLELTFFVMVRCRGSTCYPVVLAIDEDYETLRF